MCLCHVNRNEAFDVADRHGFTLALEKAVGMSALYEGAASHVLAQEDVGNQMDVRAWMARPAVLRARRRLLATEARRSVPAAGGQVCSIGR